MCTVVPYQVCVLSKTGLINTYYHNSILIWRTVSRQVDEVIRVEGDPMVWPHPQDVILYPRSSYYYDNMFINIYLFSDILSDFKMFWSLIPKNCRNVCHNVTFLDVTSKCFPSLVPCLQFTLRNIAAKAGNRR